MGPQVAAIGIAPCNQQIDVRPLRRLAQHLILREANPEGLASSLFVEGPIFQSVFQCTSRADDFDRTMRVNRDAFRDAAHKEAVPTAASVGT